MRNWTADLVSRSDSPILSHDENSRARVNEAAVRFRFF